MIFILHGDNEIRSRNAILGLGERTDLEDRKNVTPKDISPNQLKTICSNFNIFSEPPFVILDVSEAGRTNLDAYVEVISEIPAETILIVFSSKPLGKTNAFIKNASKLRAKIIQSDEPQTSNIFKFIDNVYEGKREAAYKELQSLLKSEENPMYIFSMLIYGLRNIAYAKFGAKHLSKTPFVRSKSIQQAKSFSENEVKDLFGSFYKLDKDSKTGEIPIDLLVPTAVEQVFKVFQTK